MLGVHAVPADAADLAELFGGETGDEVDKFARTAWREVPRRPDPRPLRELVRRPRAGALRRRRPRRVPARADRRPASGGAGRVHVPPRQADRSRPRGLNLTVGRLTVLTRERRCERRRVAAVMQRVTRGSCGLVPGPVTACPRAPDRAAHAARALARGAVPPRAGTARGPLPGGQPRPGQGRGPLRPAPRDRVHVVRRPDDPRRAQAPLPRPHVDDPRLARHPGGDRARREGDARRCARSSGRYPSVRRGRATAAG